MDNEFDGSNIILKTGYIYANVQMTDYELTQKTRYIQNASFKTGK